MSGSAGCALDPEPCLCALSYSVDISEVTDLHVISYEVERDLTPLILSNCQYQVEQGGESLQEFDLEKIQRQLTSHFLQGKPRLTLRGLPTLVCRRDWNYEHLFTSIRAKVPQVRVRRPALTYRRAGSAGAPLARAAPCRGFAAGTQDVPFPEPTAASRGRAGR